MLEGGEKMLKKVQGNYLKGIWECLGLHFQFTEYCICTFCIIYVLFNYQDPRGRYQLPCTVGSGSRESQAWPMEQAWNPSVCL